MSRTYRKRAESYTQFYGNEYYFWDYENKTKTGTYRYWRYASIIGFEDYVEESYVEDEAKYYTDNYDSTYFRRNKPKGYRKFVNRKRRNNDKRELWKEINLENYDGLYSKWNCRDADPSWYW